MIHKIPLVSLLFIFQVQLLCFIHHSARVSGALEPFEVHIANHLPQTFIPLITHCESRDNDLGVRNLTINHKFHWNFKMNFLESTLFHCAFWWPRQIEHEKASVTVFNKDLAYKYCGSSLTHTNICYWSVREDGFYLANALNPTPQQLHKIYNWGGH